ncbi:MAG: trypsin-like serine protease [Cytophagaceae bacterium]|nr:MAG: trypsin-like serine protease [Cytophagaceae bacterium]
MLKFILIMTGLTLMACTNRSQDRNDAHLGHADRIVGGTVSSPTDPWAASTVAIVNFPEPGARARSFCTGTLIAEDLVITAAHCLRAQPCCLAL